MINHSAANCVSLSSQIPICGNKGDITLKRQQTTRKQKETTTQWPVVAKKIVLRNIPNAQNTVIMSECKDGKYRTSNQISTDVQLIISYNYEKEVFIVWNGAAHRHLHNPNGMSTLTMGAQATELFNDGFCADCIKPTFKNLRQQGYCDCVELVVVIGKSALMDFCQNYDHYIFPDITEIPEGKKCVFARPNEDLELINSDTCQSWAVSRERDIVSRARRNSDFREGVLKKWGERCIVCGTRERRILEAAHIQSVKSGGSDDPDNGYCLCANHHRMYDAALLDIDTENQIFCCHSEAARAMPWYQRAEERHLKLYIPNNE